MPDPLSIFVNYLAINIDKNKCKNCIDKCLKCTKKIVNVHRRIVNVIMIMLKLRAKCYNINASSVEKIIQKINENLKNLLIQTVFVTPIAINLI